MPATKVSTKKQFKGTSSRKRKELAARMREAKKSKSNSESGEAATAEVLHAGGDAHVAASYLAENEAPMQSASATKLQRFRNVHVADEGGNDVQRSWVFAECGQLTNLLSAVACPECGGVGQLRITVRASMGFAQEMVLSCSACEYSNENYSSPRIGNQNDRQNVAFEANKLMVLYTHEIGVGYTCLKKLCTVFGMPLITKKTYHRLDKQVNEGIRDTCRSTLQETATIVKEVYQELFPQDQPEEECVQQWDADGIPWVDVTYDGTWMKRGFTSHYGVGIAIDLYTGYVLDFEVLSTYCHVCEMNKEKLEGMTAQEQDQWKQQHEETCRINHEGSAKSMERDAAVKIWRR